MICNQLAGGSNPSIGSETEGGVSKRSGQERTGAANGSNEREMATRMGAAIRNGRRNGDPGESRNGDQEWGSSERML